MEFKLLYCLIIQMLVSLKQQFVELLSDIGFVKEGITYRDVERAARRGSDGVIELTGEEVLYDILLIFHYWFWFDFICYYITKYLPLFVFDQIMNICYGLLKRVWVYGFMVFTATSKNISVMSWQSVLLVEETEVHRENHRHVAIHWLTLLHNSVFPDSNANEMCVTQDLNSFREIIAHAQCSVDEKKKLFCVHVYHIRIIAKKKKLVHTTWNRQIPQ